MGRARWVRNLVTLAVLGVASGCSSSAAEYTPPPITASVGATEPFSTLLTSLDSPVDILVVGDGTGPSLGGWVYLTLQNLTERSGRPGLVREWNYESGTGYLEAPVAEIAGDGAPITVWNASVSRNVDFLNEALPGMIPPADVDLVLVNNGLDMGAATLAEASIPLMRRLGTFCPDAGVVAILQPSPPGEVERIHGNVRDLEISSRINHFQTIDVSTAFGSASGVYDGTDRYSNLDGQRLWSSVVTDALLWDIGVPVA
jgi:hypothetical protein